MRSHEKQHAPNRILRSVGVLLGLLGVVTALPARATTPPSLFVTVAGDGIQGYTGDGLLAIGAELYKPTGVAIDASSNLYIADQVNNMIRKVDHTTGIISTVAGDYGNRGYYGDGSFATSAGLNNPSGVAIDASGNLYIADYYNNVIRKVDHATGIISTVAGNHRSPGYYGDGSQATSAGLHYPEGVAIDASGNLYIADSGNSVIRKVNHATGNIFTVAGSYRYGYSGDGSLATYAGLENPCGVAIDASGNLYIADTNNNVIRKVDHATGIISTFAGNGSNRGYSGVGSPATRATFNLPFGVAIDASGNLYVADTYNSAISDVSYETTYPSIAPTAPDSATVTLTFVDLSGAPTIYAGLDGATPTAIASGSGTVVGTVPVSGSGSHTLTYYSIDALGNQEAPQTLSLTTPLPPLANHQLVPVHFNTPTPVTLSATDPYGNALTYSVTSPSHGTLTGTAPHLTYHPAQGFIGSDSFTFQALDGSIASTTAAVNLTVTDTAPIASSQSVMASQDTPLSITLSASDPDGDPIPSYSVYPPVHGTLVKTSVNQYTYTPNPGFAGTDMFLFQANDDLLASSPAIVTITVTSDPSTPPPTANYQSVPIHFNTPTPVTLSATSTSTDGLVLTYSIVASPSHGTLSGTAPNLTYTPNLRYTGRDAFTFQAKDGTIASNTAKVTINVTHTASVASNQSVTTSQGTPVSITLSATDPDEDPITSYSVYSPLHCTLVKTSANQYTYTPNPGYTGNDLFFFQANDGLKSSTAANVTITVTP